MRTLLNVVCGLTLAASAWLGVMFVVLHHPGFERGLVMASLFALQSLLAVAVTNHWLGGLAWRSLSIAGAIGLGWAGGRAVIDNLNNSHFEGYVLIIGFLLISQSLLTLLASSSKVHQFGN